MRPIKFRAWDKVNKCWLNPRQHWMKLIPDCIQGTTTKIGLEEIDLMQFTGLHDKNGKEIWEGDIFDYRGQRVIIEYVGDMFHCKSTKYPNISDGNYRLDTLRKECEVIGNIYENKELL